MKLETKVREALEKLLNNADTNVVVDSLIPAGEVMLATFHLEGAWASPVEFTFPFAEFIPLDESLASLRDLISRNWATAHMPPPEAPFKGGLRPPVR